MAWISRYGLPSILNVRAFFIFMNEIQKTNTNVQVFKYNGTGITFKVGDNLMVNATEMAKNFGKQPYDWFRLPSTIEFLKAFIMDYEGTRSEKISERYAEISERNISEILSLYGLVFIQQGGNMQGTWLYDEIAIELARWLSPEFSIWCNKRIKEILNGGSKYPMTSDEAIAYGYGKALEKINRQSTIIARQSKQLQKYKSQLEVEKEKKEQKRIVFAQTLTDDVKDWILTIGVTGVIKLSTLHQKYHDWCTDNGRSYITIRQLAAQLRILGYASIHKRNGTWFII